MGARLVENITPDNPYLYGRFTEGGIKWKKDENLKDMGHCKRRGQP